MQDSLLFVNVNNIQHPNDFWKFDHDRIINKEIIQQESKSNYFPNSSLKYATQNMMQIWL